MTAKESRVGPLDTTGHIATELGKLYRAARRGDIDTADAVRLAGILKELRAVIAIQENSWPI